MRRVIFKFAGGPLDGKTISGEPRQEGEAREYYLLTYHGKLGQRFRVASEYVVSVLTSEHFRVETPHHFHPCIYEVVERIANRKVLLVRAEYVKKA